MILSEILTQLWVCNLGILLEFQIEIILQLITTTGLGDLEIMI